MCVLGVSCQRETPLRQRGRFQRVVRRQHTEKYLSAPNYSPVPLIFHILTHNKRSPTRHRVGPQAARGRAFERGWGDSGAHDYRTIVGGVWLVPNRRTSARMGSIGENIKFAAVQKKRPLMIQRPPKWERALQRKNALPREGRSKGVL